MGNIALILVCLLTSGYVLWETGTYPPPADPSMDAGLYPRFLVFLLLFLTVLLAVELYRKYARGERSVFVAPPAKASLLMAGCMVGYCILMSLVGYAIATVSFAFAATLLFRGTPKEGLLVGIGITCFLEVLFRGAFQVPLPPGMLNLF